MWRIWTTFGYEDLRNVYQRTKLGLAWIALSFAPLDKWVPAMADVTAHTELLTATALGVEFGGYRRWGQVAG